MTQREEKLIDAVTQHISWLRSAAYKAAIVLGFNNYASSLQREADKLAGALAGYTTDISDEVLGGDLDMEDGSEGRDEEEMRAEEPNWEHSPHGT